MFRPVGFIVCRLFALTVLSLLGGCPFHTQFALLDGISLGLRAPDRFALQGA